MKTTSLKIFVLFALLAVTGRVAVAQTKAGSLEFGGYSGAAFNLQGSTAIVCTSSSRCATSEGSQTHGVIGGQVGVGVASWLLLVGDVAHIPLGSASAALSGQTSSVSGSATTFHGALDFQPKFKRVVPFGSIGWGVYHQGGKGALMETSADVSASKFSGQVGGGVRVFVSEHVGLKVGFYGISIKTGSGNTSADFSSFGMFKAGVVFRSR